MEYKTNFENTIDYWDKIGRMSRRSFYSPILDQTDEMVIDSVMKVYPGNTCHQRFNFLLEGNRCNQCNILSLLTTDGELDDRLIPINVGRYKGFFLKIEQSPKIKHLALYRRVNQDLSKIYSLFPNIDGIQRILRDISDTVFVENDTSLPSHLFIGGASISGVNNNINDAFMCYMCNSVKFVTLVHEEKILNRPLSEKESLTVFCCILTMIASDNYYIPSYSLDLITFQRGKFSIILSDDDEIDVDIIPTFIGNKHLVVSGSSDKSYRLFRYKCNDVSPIESLNNIPFDIHISKTPKREYEDVFDIGNPTLDEYKERATLTLKPSRAFFDFLKSTSIYVFEYQPIYMAMLMLLCNENFYKAFTLYHRDILLELFFEDELEWILKIVAEYHGKPNPSTTDLEKLAIIINFSMKLDSRVPFISFVWEKFCRIHRK